MGNALGDAIRAEAARQQEAWMGIAAEADRWVLPGGPTGPTGGTGPTGPSGPSGGTGPTGPTGPDLTCHVIAGMPPKGVQWHADFPSPYPENNARRNLRWLLGCYGTSWAWTYLVRSATALSNDVMTFYGSDEGGRIIATFTGQGNFGPQGMLVPYGGSVKPGHIFTTLNPMCSIPLPYPDDWVA